MKRIIFVMSIGMFCMKVYAMDEKTPLKPHQQNSLVWPRPPASARHSKGAPSYCQEYCYISCCLYGIFACLACSPNPFSDSYGEKKPTAARDFQSKK